MAKVTPEAPPAWARPEQQVATQRQLDFIISLKAERQLNEEQHRWLAAQIENNGTLLKSKASTIIERLLKLPKATTVVSGNGITDNDARLAVGVPAGRYAVEADNGELRFYNVWVSRDKKRLSVYVAHGPDESDLKYQRTVLGVLNKIKNAGIRECAIRYGMEIGSCSNCGRRLTNRISRELGIGPVCGGRMFGDGFKQEVKTKRAELKARGINPDEELDD